MDKLEMCARAIHDTAVRYGSFQGGWDDQPREYQERCRLYAAAVLEESRGQQLGPRMLQSMKSLDRRVSRGIGNAFNSLRGTGRARAAGRQVPGE